MTHKLFTSTFIPLYGIRAERFFDLKTFFLAVFLKEYGGYYFYFIFYASSGDYYYRTLKNPKNHQTLKNP
ncbi:hypothetical protein YC2023_025161 [Brassica napus]